MADVGGASLWRVVDAVSDRGVALLDEAGKVVRWNASAQRITGYAPADIVGRGFGQLFDEEDRRAGTPDAALETARRNGRHESAGWRRRKDGSRFWATVTLERTRDERGALLGYVATVREAEGYGSGTEHRLRLLVESITGYAIMMLDPNGIVVYANPGVAKIQGYEPDEIVGRHFSRFFTEEDHHRGEPEHALMAAARDGKIEREAWRVRKDGSRFYAHVIVEAIRDETGELTGFAKAVHDVTDKWKAQEVLEASERQFRLLVEGVTDYALFMLDPNGVVTNWNTGAQRIKGYAAEEIVGLHFSRFYTAEDRAAGIPARALEEAREHGRYESEGWRVRKDGSRFWASIVIDAIREGGRLVGFAKITRDISERRRAQAALESTRERLAQAQRMEAIGQLTGGVAHDFNNLLMVIGGRLEVMRRRTQDSVLLGDLASIERAAEKGERLTRQLLAFSRRQMLRPAPLDLREWLSRTLEMLRPSLRGDIAIRARVASDLWPIEVDAAELELALLNLAINAHDALPNGGTVVIRASNEVLKGTEELPGGDYVRIAVSDSGVGIAPDVLPHVFEPFFTTKEVGKGTGLGLAQVYGFAVQSGGTAKVSSRLGEGTTVILLLPRSHRVASPAFDRKAGEAELSPPRARILLVEDNAEVAEVTGIMLRSLGHEVTHVHDAKAALHRAVKESFDLVISDVVMPGGMNGIELAARLGAEKNGPPVLLITGYSNAAREAAESGLTILSKPFQIRALELAIVAKLKGARNVPRVSDSGK